MNHALNRLLAILMLLSVSAAPMVYAAPPLPDPWDDYDEAVFMDMDLDENVMTPALRKEEKHAVRTYMRKLATELVHKKIRVELDRDDEVVVAVMPTDQLFMPNDTLLSPRGLHTLKPVMDLLKQPGMYKVVYTVHTDNTGSDEYNMWLSQERVNSLYDWMLDQVSEDLVLIPFSMGDTDPIATNDTRKGRAENRRVEFYLIPGPEMILKARNKKL